MRKEKKLALLELVKSFYEANQEMKIVSEEGKMTQLKNMIAQYQEYAIDLGNIIEESEGEGIITVIYIAEYCEILYRFYNATEKEGLSQKDYEILQNQMKKIEDSIKHDISIKKEIVFLPYKASMWDSMESVYLAAKEDTVHCDAYCVPIPYFEINSDNQMGTMHYEGKEYPSNIEITDWQDYNFEERRPDVVVIHNPYDDWNRVTSVHPMFYARNLKKYTEELVYIPYFVVEEIEENDQEAINGMKHFCYLPGTIYADKVILQSNNIANIYKKEYMSQLAKQQIPINEEEVNRKFLGLGSPKFDKVLTTKKEDYL